MDLSITFVYKILPVFIRYTDDMPSWRSIKIIGPYVKMRPHLTYDERFHAYCKSRVRQFYSSFGLSGIFSKISIKYKISSDIDAYLDGFSDDQKSIDEIVTSVYDRYGSHMSYDAIKALVYNKLHRK